MSGQLCCPEARCPACGWEGMWDEVVYNITYHRTQDDPEEGTCDCPLCGTEVRALGMNDYHREED